MDDLICLQVVGYKNSGKTTLINRWIKTLGKNGTKTSVIKHHGHGGPLEMPDPGTDGMTFLETGAVSSLVLGDGMIQFHGKTEAPLNELIKLSQIAYPDVILIEGFKKEKENKIIILRSMEDWETLKDLEHILLVVAPEGVRPNCGFPVIDRNNLEELERWILKYVNSLM
ncbi:molybdopterin-guanine dinucleotide biosynthesis protein B [Bacillus sp. 1P06AnD]|uniref:molybdopterin-guanine dinucleotide biosynthesis protein B n=1 Tax=Bacillus sp. 1P06AnD TaxID=3132208 RepID=UPI0039A14C37